MNNIISHPIPPVWNSESRILILGTMPSPKSREARFFYMHPRNRFWSVMAEVFGETLAHPNNAPDHTAAIEERRAFLLRHHLAMWDVLASCEREGSLDSAIREGETSDIPGLLAACPAIRKICLNGGTAARLFEKHFGEKLAGVERVRLPSTSPAYTLSYENKLALWRAAIGGEE